MAFSSMPGFTTSNVKPISSRIARRVAELEPRMRGADEPALVILMTRATASDKMMLRINRRRRRRGRHTRFVVRPVPRCCGRNEQNVCWRIQGVSMRTSSAPNVFNVSVNVNVVVVCSRTAPSRRDASQLSAFGERVATRRSTLTRHGHSRERTTRP